MQSKNKFILGLISGFILGGIILYSISRIPIPGYDMTSVLSYGGIILFFLAVLGYTLYKVNRSGHH